MEIISLIVMALKFATLLYSAYTDAKKKAEAKQEKFTLDENTRRRIQDTAVARISLELAKDSESMEEYEAKIRELTK